MKTSRKILVLVLALVMVFACAVPAFAVQAGDPGSEPIPSTTPTETGVFHVKLNIQSYSKTSSGTTTGPFKVFGLDVQLGTTGVTNSFTVEDVVNAAASQHSSIVDFYIANDTTHGHYVKKIKDAANSKWYEALSMKSGSNTYLCGWMFRLNGKIPMLNSTDGAGISQTYVKSGDVIDFYYANPYITGSTDHSTKFMAIGVDSAGFQLLFSDLYIASGATNWTIGQFTTPGLAYIKVYVDGTLDTNTLTDGTGHFALSGTYTGTHTIRVEYRYNAYNTFTNSSGTVSYGVPRFVDAVLDYTF